MSELKCPYCDKETKFQVQTVLTGQSPFDKITLVVCTNCLKPIGSLESYFIHERISQLSNKIDELLKKG